MKLALNDLKNICSDNKSGSSQIFLKLNQWFTANKFDIKTYNYFFDFVEKELSGFAIISNYVIQCRKKLNEGNVKSLREFQKNILREREKEILRLVKASIKILGNYENFLTISNSQTIELFFCELSKKKKFNLVICESRPVYEGRILAENLLVKKNININMVTEAMIANEVEKCDAVVFGADQIFSNGNVVNKVGSKSLSICAKYFHKPVYVIADKSKSKEKYIFETRIESKMEIWKNPPPKLKIENYYFELIEKELITKLITN